MKNSAILLALGLSITTCKARKSISNIQSTQDQVFRGKGCQMQFSAPDSQFSEELLQIEENTYGVRVTYKDYVPSGHLLALMSHLKNSSSIANPNFTMADFSLPNTVNLSTNILLKGLTFPKGCLDKGMCEGSKAIYTTKSTSYSPHQTVNGVFTADLKVTVKGRTLFIQHAGFDVKKMQTALEKFRNQNRELVVGDNVVAFGLNITLDLQPESIAPQTLSVTSWLSSPLDQNLGWPRQPIDKKRLQQHSCTLI